MYNNTVLYLNKIEPFFFNDIDINNKYKLYLI